MSNDRMPNSMIIKNLMIIGTVLLGLGAALSALIFVLFMYTEAPEPGSVLVIYDKPYFFGSSGIRKDVIKDERVFLFRSSTAKNVNMTPQSIHVSLDDFSDRDSILLDFETTIQFRYTNPVMLVESFGDSWFDSNVRRPYMSMVREAVKKHSMAEMMTDVSVAAAIDGDLTKQLVALVKESGVPIEIMNVSLGRAKPNESVLRQMNETAAQHQRVKTMMAATEAENQRKQEQIAKAQADNAYRNAMNLDPNQFIELEKIKAYSQVCAKSTCIIDASGKTAVTLGR